MNRNAPAPELEAPAGMRREVVIVLPGLMLAMMLAVGGDRRLRSSRDRHNARWMQQQFE